MATTKEKTKAILIKWGNNANDVEKMVNEHFEYAYRVYGNKPKTLADVIRTLY